MPKTPTLPPGPWEWRDFGDGLALSSEQSPAGSRLLARDGDGWLVPITPDHPVARALAATPALLANLRYALWCLDNPRIPPTPDALDTMRAALALAEPLSPPQGDHADAGPR
jgi:hypothetical protein